MRYASHTPPSFSNISLILSVPVPVYLSSCRPIFLPLPMYVCVSMSLSLSRCLSFALLVSVPILHGISLSFQHSSLFGSLSSLPPFLYFSSDFPFSFLLFLCVSLLLSPSLSLSILHSPFLPHFIFPVAIIKSLPVSLYLCLRLLLSLSLCISSSPSLPLLVRCLWGHFIITSRCVQLPWPRGAVLRCRRIMRLRSVMQKNADL